MLQPHGRTACYVECFIENVLMLYNTAEHHPKRPPIPCAAACRESDTAYGGLKGGIIKIGKEIHVLLRFFLF